MYTDFFHINNQDTVPYRVRVETQAYYSNSAFTSQIYVRKAPKLMNKTYFPETCVDLH